MGQDLIFAPIRLRACRGGPGGRLTGRRIRRGPAPDGGRNRRERAGAQARLTGPDRSGDAAAATGLPAHRHERNVKDDPVSPGIRRPSDIPRLRGIEQFLA
ncbi:hypothetical protein DIE23_05380 [Burkholderia sp. Bp9143]|nr:hypothetical protein DIE23_05380 [Burkholderia sp. Bp9143]